MEQFNQAHRANKRAAAEARRNADAQTDAISLMTNPTDPAAVAHMVKDAAQRLLQQNVQWHIDPQYLVILADAVLGPYGDQREAAERERVIQWLERKGGRANAIDVAMALRRGDHLKGQS